jgi:hypothetical protein
MSKKTKRPPAGTANWLQRLKARAARLSPGVVLGLALGLALGVVALGLSGCVKPSALEQDFGRSVANNTAQQVLNPRAGQDLTPATGYPPKVGTKVLERYEKSFEEKKEMEKLTTK